MTEQDAKLQLLNTNSIRDKIPYLGEIHDREFLVQQYYISQSPPGQAADSKLQQEIQEYQFELAYQLKNEVIQSLDTGEINPNAVKRYKGHDYLDRPFTIKDPSGLFYEEAWILFANKYLELDNFQLSQIIEMKQYHTKMHPSPATFRKEVIMAEANARRISAMLPDKGASVKVN